MPMKIEDVLDTGLFVTVHAVSGEFYEGICKRNPANTLLFDIHNRDRIVTLPLWSVKRVWSTARA